MTVVRIARQDYDKPHRCPGWAGSGWNFTTLADDETCPNGYVAWYDKPFAKWRTNTCTKKCGTLVLPYATRYVDPSWYRMVAPVWPLEIEWWVKEKLHIWS